MHKWGVIVGNIGSVYHGHDEADARDHFKEYREISIYSRGHRGFGEVVTLLCDGLIKEEHDPQVED